jgi:formylglycine-generating enzyme required for sulfatase activity
MDLISCPHCQFEFRTGSKDRLTCPLCDAQFNYSPDLVRLDTAPFIINDEGKILEKTPPFIEPDEPESESAVPFTNEASVSQPTMEGISPLIRPVADPGSAPIPVHTPTEVEIVPDEETLPDESGWGGLLDNAPQAEALPDERMPIQNIWFRYRHIFLGILVLVLVVISGILFVRYGKLVAELVSLLSSGGNGASVMVLENTPTIENTLTVTPLTEPTNTTMPTVTPTPELGIGSIMVSEKDGMVMVYVPFGEFTMGSNLYAGSEGPPHSIYLDAYWIDQTEVTNAQYAKFLTEVGNQIEEGALWFNEGKIYETDDGWVVEEGYEDYAVVFVTWYGARAYCDWTGKRLPTEAEWEKAARGTDERIFPWGDEEPICDLAQFGGCGEEEQRVGSYPNGTSPYGALDMAGNVWEWVYDLYETHYYDISPTENPTGPEEGSWRVMRGGAWNSTALELRTTVRSKVSLKFGGHNSGFRCVLEP